MSEFFRGQAGGDTPRPAEEICQTVFVQLPIPLHFFYSVLLLLLAYNLDQKVLLMLELETSTLTSVFHPSPTSSIFSPEPVVHICVTICRGLHFLSNKLDS